jgi:uncharacterized membrane protein
VIQQFGTTACRVLHQARSKRTIVDGHCLECHSERPTNRAFPIAPQGDMFDTALQMQEYAARIEARVVEERTMPLANMSGMTDDGRLVLGRWSGDRRQTPALSPFLLNSAVLFARRFSTTSTLIILIGPMPKESR